VSLDPVVIGRTGGARLLFAIVTLLGLTIIYAPTLYLLFASLNPGEQLGLVAPNHYSLAWYAALLHDRRLLAALEESALVGLATATLTTPIALAAALAYRAMTRMRSLFLLVILSAMFVPGTIEGLGISVVLRLAHVSPSWITVTIGHLLWALPFAVIVSLIGLSAVAPSTLGAARDLGAGPLRAFIDVTLPLMRGSLVSCFVLAFLLSLNEHARAFFLVGRQNTLPLYMFGAMNSGASPTIYAFSGAVVVVSLAALGLIFVGAAAPRGGFTGVHGAKAHET
jgi:ABC-type spermidine/putrescine transport system permease subunit II